MNRGSRPSRGYTIVETLIFLAVSSAMLVTAMVLVGGRQAKTEFSNAIREFELQLSDVVNEVSSGYYPDTDNFTCTGDDTQPRPVIASQATGQFGGNKGCVYLGQFLQFSPQGRGSEYYRVYTAVGRQYVAGSNNRVYAQTLNELRPVLVARGAAARTNWPDVGEFRKFGGGVTVERVEYSTDGTSYTPVGAIGLFSKLQASGAVGGLDSGMARTTVIVPRNTTSTMLNQLPGTFVDWADNINEANIYENPAGGVRICLKSDAANQYAWVSLGGSTSGGFTTNAVFRQGGSCI